MPTLVPDYISFAWVDHNNFLVMGYHTCIYFLNGYILIISHLYVTATHWVYRLQWNVFQYWVFSYKYSLYHHTRVKLIFWSLGCHLCLMFENECYQPFQTLQWSHNEHDGVSNHQHHDCLFNRLFRRRSMKTAKLRVTGLCEGNSRMAGEFPTQRASNAGIVSIWWRHHDDFHQLPAQRGFRPHHWYLYMANCHFLVWISVNSFPPILCLW